MSCLPDPRPQHSTAGGADHDGVLYVHRRESKETQVASFGRKCGVGTQACRGASLLPKKAGEGGRGEERKTARERGSGRPADGQQMRERKARRDLKILPLLLFVHFQHSTIPAAPQGAPITMGYQYARMARSSHAGLCLAWTPACDAMAGAMRQIFRLKKADYDLACLLGRVKRCLG